MRTFILIFFSLLSFQVLGKDQVRVQFQGKEIKVQKPKAYTDELSLVLENNSFTSMILKIEIDDQVHQFVSLKNNTAKTIDLKISKGSRVIATSLSPPLPSIELN